MTRDRNLLQVGGCLLLATVVAACSDPVSPPAQGGLSIRVTPPSSGTCGVTYQATIPTTDAPTPTSAGTPLTDGDLGAKVSCVVKEDGDGYYLNGSISFGQLSYNIVGHVPASGTSAADVRVTAQNTSQGTSPLQGGCTVTIGSSPQTVAAGEIFATFSCPEFNDNMSPDIRCSSEGTVVFERCSK